MKDVPLLCHIVIFTARSATLVLLNIYQIIIILYYFSGIMDIYNMVSIILPVVLSMFQYYFHEVSKYH